MNILYLRGLESKLSDEKRAILETYGTVITPDLDYKSNPDANQNLYNGFNNQNINAIIGSSMGGYAAYHLANSLGICAMFDNPALPYRNSVVENIPSDLPKKRSLHIRIVLGGLDDVIKAKDNLAFLAQNFSELKECTIQIVNELAHQIPVAVFEKQSEVFFQELCYCRMLNANDLITNKLATFSTYSFNAKTQNKFSRGKLDPKKIRMQ